jgi:uncharacterized protein (TIGR02246 family)
MTINTDHRSVVDALCDAFNTKDHQAFSALFTEDAEFVNIFGVRMRRRDGISAGHAHAFSKLLVGSQLSWTNVDTMFIDEDVAVCHAQWSRVRLADSTPETLPPGTGIFTLVLHRVGGGWKIVAATNVQDTTPPKASA